MPKQRLIYGRRRGRRLRAGRERLLADKLPEVEIGLAEGGKLDPSGLFDPPRPLWLEIGFGGGEHLAWQARAHPEVGLIGCEPFIEGVAKLLLTVEAERLENVRIVVDDARLLLDALPDRSLERIFVLFPDPWPKARHHKRRLINRETAAEFARLLVSGGKLRLATDDMSYARAMLLALLAEPRLEWLAQSPRDWRERSADWPPTRYEEKAIEAGRDPVYLRFRRRVRPSP